MHKVEFENCGRSMRWYEWLTGLFLLSLALGVRAESIYKCVDAEGKAAYQATKCPAQQHESVIEIPPPPTYAPAPRYAVERRVVDAPARASHVPLRVTSREMAYECHVSDGRLFYRLGNCPHSIPGAIDGAQKPPRGKSGNSHSSGGSAQVTSRRIPREDACHEIHRAGAIGRNGHEFDEHVSTYEHNLGHDPCK